MTELELCAHSEIPRQQPEHKVRLHRQRVEQMRNPWHQAAGAMRFLQGQTEARDIALVEDVHQALSPRRADA